MFVLTAKLSKTKLAAIITAIIAIIVLVVIIHAANTEPASTDGPAGDTNDARVVFLAQYGWEVNAEPVQTQSVSVPKEDSEVFTRYNKLQKSQGFDLTAYAGKQAMRYVYEILNYPGATEPVYATLFVCDGRIIGGDVTDTAPQGKLHGFALPKQAAGPA